MDFMDLMDLMMDVMDLFFVQEHYSYYCCLLKVMQLRGRIYLVVRGLDCLFVLVKRICLNG